MPIIIGYSRPFLYKKSLIWAVASHPSRIGMLKSIKIRSNLELWKESTSSIIILTASYPLSAVKTTISISYIPKNPSRFFTAIQLNGSSSTTRILFLFSLMRFLILNFSCWSAIYSFFFWTFL